MRFGSVFTGATSGVRRGRVIAALSPRSTSRERRPAKIGRIDGAEIDGDRIAEDRPVFRAGKAERIGRTRCRSRSSGCGSRVDASIPTSARSDRVRAVCVRLSIFAPPFMCLRGSNPSCWIGCRHSLCNALGVDLPDSAAVEARSHPLAHGPDRSRPSARISHRHA
jgi:hypothetical protein